MLRTIDHNQQPTLNLCSHIPHLLTQSTVNHSNLPYVHKHFTTSHFKLPTPQQISTILFPPYLPTPHVHQRINLLTGLLLNTAFGVGLLCCVSSATFVGTLPLGPRDATIHHTVYLHPIHYYLDARARRPRDARLFTQTESVVTKTFYITLKQILHSGTTHTVPVLLHIYTFYNS